MKANKIINPLMFFLLVLANVGCDQISKSIVRKNVDYFENIKVVDSYVILTKVENPGAFLSLGTNLPSEVKEVVLTIFPIIALSIGLIFLLTKYNLPKLLSIGISFVIGGGIGNIYDRIIYKSVTDFLHIDLGIFRTGIFNMADVSIMTGMFLIFINSYLTRRKAQEQDEEITES